MDLSIFDFYLPRKLIAKRPARPRDNSRLLYLQGSSILDLKFTELTKLLKPNDLLVLNNTRVIPARLIGTRKSERGTSKIEITLNNRLDNFTWNALAKPARRLRSGDEIFFDRMEALVISVEGKGIINLRFKLTRSEIIEELENIGQIPIPPYLERRADEQDSLDYQTVYGDKKGAIAAPTAGLHFTTSLLNRLESIGVKKTFVTLHVGAGTFLPVATDSINDHKMHSEWGKIDECTVQMIKETKINGGRIIAVGTTVLRLLESAINADGEIIQFQGSTDIFLTPGHEFSTADLLLTNFHLPKSTLFILVCGFMGIEEMHYAYKHAIQAEYRFYSYGDCCLLNRIP